MNCELLGTMVGCVGQRQRNNYCHWANGVHPSMIKLAFLCYSRLDYCGRLKIQESLQCCKLCSEPQNAPWHCHSSQTHTHASQCIYLAYIPVHYDILLLINTRGHGHQSVILRLICSTSTPPQGGTALLDLSLVVFWIPRNVAFLSLK